MTRSNRTHHTILLAHRTADSGLIAPLGFDAPSNLSRAEIAARTLSAPTAVERRRWQVIGLVADQASLAEIVAATGYRPRTIREIAQRYRVLGAAALVDRRAQSRGAPSLLTLSLQHELWQALQGSPPDGGVWTGPKVARWIAARTGKRVHRQRGWEYLRQLGGSAVPADGGQHAADTRDDDPNRSA
jgi:transposase